MAEDERNRLLSDIHTNDDDATDNVKGVSYGHSKSASSEFVSSIKDVCINEDSHSKATSLFHRSSSASKSHRRVVRQDSDSDDDDDIGPPVPPINSSQLQPSTNTGNDSDDDEIGPPAPAAEALPNVRQGDLDKGSDEEIGPPLPDTAASKSKQKAEDLVDEKTSDDDDDDDDDDDSEVIVIFVFKMLMLYFRLHADVDTAFCCS